LVLSRVRLIRVRLVLVNFIPINDTYIQGRGPSVPMPGEKERKSRNNFKGVVGVWAPREQK